jgi:ankyrin repeat protein
MTPLMWASREGHTDTVVALIGAGVDFNLKQEVR